MPSSKSQLSFDGFAAPVPRVRLFFALFPDAEARSRIAEEMQRLRGVHGLRGGPIATDRYHVTLQFLGDYLELEPSLVEAASRAASAVAFPAFELSLDTAASFRGKHRHPFVLKCGEEGGAVQGLWQALREPLLVNGFRTLEKRFTPHVTLLYDERIRVEPEPIAPIRWTVREFALVHSAIGETRYTLLGRWPLRSS